MDEMGKDVWCLLLQEIQLTVFIMEQAMLHFLLIVQMS